MRTWITILMVGFLAGMPVLGSATVSPSGYAAAEVTESAATGHRHASSRCCSQKTGDASNTERPHHADTHASPSAGETGDPHHDNCCPADCPGRGECGQAVLCVCAGTPVLSAPLRPFVPGTCDSYLLSHAPTARIASTHHVERLKRPPRLRTGL